MRKALLILCFAIPALLCHAQQRLDEVVYLKNGTIRRGMIMEYVPNTSLKIKSNDTLFSYKLDEIEKITREPVPPYDFKIKSGKPIRYVGIVEVGATYFPSVNQSSLPMFSINVVNAYQASPYFSVGVGVGGDISKPQVYNVPITLDLRAYTGRHRMTPFFALGFGYDLHILRQLYYGTTFTNSMIVNPAVGARIAINKKFAMSLGVGYKLLVVHATDIGAGHTLQSVTDLEHGMTFKLGFHF